MQSKNKKQKEYQIILNNLSNNLRKLRNEKNMSQIELSYEIGISSRTYQYLESNSLTDIKFSTIFKIADYYNISLDELIKIEK